MALSFGTDGVRGLVGSELDGDAVRALGIAAARKLGGDRVILGRDTRRSSSALTSAFAEGVISEGLEVVSLGVVPTPAVAHVARLETAAGAVITASHNPWNYNGVKFFGLGGRKLTDEVEIAIQSDWEQLPRVGEINNTSVIEDKEDQRWTDALVASVEPSAFTGFRILVDCANGSTSGVAAAVLTRLGAEVSELNADPNGRNINEDCGSTYPVQLQKEVVECSADLGLAFDGDGDRVVAVATDGSLLDGDHLLAVCAVDRLERGLLPSSTVVVTPMANLGLRRGLAKRGIISYEVPVGDRYLLEAMESRDFVLGGEQSGHIVFGDLATTGDGILTGIQALDAARRVGQPLGELSAAIFERVPQVIVNVPVVRPVIEVATEVADDVIAAAVALGDEGRVLVRPSGTEPLVRVMVEALDENLANVMADRLCEIVRRSDEEPTGGADNS